MKPQKFGDLLKEAFNITGEGGSGQSTAGTSFMSTLVAKMPFSYKVLQNIEILNPKYEIFSKLAPNREEKLQKLSVTKPTQNDDVGGTILINKDYHKFMYANLDLDKVRRLQEYRRMACYAELSDCLDEICDEVIVKDENNNVIHFFLKGDVEKNVKEEIRKEWDNFISYFDLENKGWAYFRNLLIDGELYFENIISKEKKDLGILGILSVPSELINPIYDNVQNSFVNGFLLRRPVTGPRRNMTRQESEELVALEANQITYVSSGIWNEDRTIRLPYIENSRRAFKQLSLIEDSIVIYRMVRAPERLVFKVDVGNMSPAKAENYLKRLMSQFWAKKSFDSTTGRITNIYDPMSMLDAYWFAKRAGTEGTTVETLPGGCLAMDTKIPLLDGRELSLYEMTKEYQDGKENWVYSCNPKNGNIVPGKVSWAGVTQKSAKVMQLTFDNNEKLICTLDHKFPTVLKGKKRADELEVGDSIYARYIRNNHKVIKIEYLSDPIEVGTLTIDKNEEIHDFHTFATCSGVTTYNSNLGQLEDLMYFMKKLYKSLKVPTSRLDPNDPFKDGSEITREELRFARFVMRIQTQFAQGIRLAFIAHLKLKEMWKKYGLKELCVNVTFNSPSHFAAMREQQIIELKFNNYGTITQNEGIANSFAQRYYLGLNDHQMSENREWRRKDAELSWEIDQIKSNGPSWKEMQQQAQDIEGAVAGGGGGSGGGGGGGQMSSSTPPNFGGAASVGAPPGGAPPGGAVNAAPGAGAPAGSKLPGQPPAGK